LQSLSVANRAVLFDSRVSHHLSFNLSARKYRFWWPWRSSGIRAGKRQAAASHALFRCDSVIRHSLIVNGRSNSPPTKPA